MTSVPDSSASSSLLSGSSSSLSTGASTGLYRGRFAPSPTGPLHFGSLVAAVASCCEARFGAAKFTRPGEWHLRIEDVDAPRTVPGAEDAILATLEALGFEWDGPVVRQRDRRAAYEAALEHLRSTGAVFPCACTRREIADSSLVTESGELLYPGTCRDGPAPGRETTRALRVRVRDEVLVFEDAVQGRILHDLARETGDFVALRADGLVAYQLAVVVDDRDSGITDVVRGADLLGSTPRQILLARLLGASVPRHAHVPVAVNAAGKKLSKQTLAPAIDAGRAAAELARALRFLGQPAPDALDRATPREVWAWAAEHWSLARVPRARQISAA